MFKAYMIKDSYWAQIEGKSIINLRFGYTCMGFGTKKHIRCNSRRSKYSLFPLNIKFMAHTGQCDMVEVFHFSLGRFKVWYKTKGDTTPELHRYKERGLHFSFPPIIRKWSHG